MLFEAPHTTYVIVIPALNKRQWHPAGVLLEDKVYIGSTTKSIHSRQDARVRKLRLLQEGQFTNTEVMVHYFHTRSDFFHALILPGVVRFPEARTVWFDDVVFEADLLRVLHLAVYQSDGMQLSVSLHFFEHSEQILARLADEMSCLICPGLTANG